jgi:hypothetical protein
MDVATTGTPSGHLVAVGTHTGIIPLHQHIGVFTTPSQTEYAGVKHTGGTVWVDGIDAYGVIFVDDDDAIYIGAVAQFSEIEVIMNVGATKSVAPTFWYNTAADAWTQFFPADDTDGFQQSGDIRFDVSSITGSWTNNGDPGVGDTTAGYWIKIVRTRNGTVGSPDPTTVKTGTITEYEWDENGDISIKGGTFAGNIIVAGNVDGRDVAADGTKLDNVVANTQAITHAITDNKTVTVDGTTNAPANLDYAKRTALGLEGRSYAQVVSDILPSFADQLTGAHLSQTFGATAGRLHNLITTPIAGMVLRVLNIGSASPFSGDIHAAGTGGITATNVPYDGDSNENMFEGMSTYDGSSYWGQIILHNTTKGESCKIVSVDRTDDHITVTADSPNDVSAWDDDDVITCQSQTNAQAGYFDVDVSDNIAATDAGVFFFMTFDDKENNYDSGRYAMIHPYVAYDAGKRAWASATNALEKNTVAFPMDITSQKITMIFGSGCVDASLGVYVKARLEYADT